MSATSDALEELDRLRLAINDPAIVRAVEWLQSLQFDHEYGQCGGCRARNFGSDIRRQHDPSCGLQNTINGLKRIADNGRASE